jgi:hypothetical protein
MNSILPPENAVIQNEFISCWKHFSPLWLSILEGTKEVPTPEDQREDYALLSL